MSDDLRAEQRRRYVAVDAADETFHLTATAARRLARELIAAARECDRANALHAPRVRVARCAAPRPARKPAPAPVYGRNIAAELGIKADAEYFARVLDAIRNGTRR